MNKDIIKLLGLTGKEDSSLYSGLEQALSEMEGELKKICLSADNSLTEDLLRVIRSGGKRLRPVLAYLGYAAGMESDERKEYDYPAVPLMMAIELVHTSSLIHDDIVDMACVRRSVPTINATSGNFRAVQAGDYLLAKAAHAVRHYKDLKLGKHFAGVARGMCAAEFMQIESENRFCDTSLKDYFEQIKRKTAAFIASSGSLGARISGAPQKEADALEEYGKNIGIAFQIRDDVLDYVADRKFGKKCGQDIARGILTLPLIFALNKTDAGALKPAGTSEKNGDDLSLSGEGLLKPETVSENTTVDGRLSRSEALRIATSSVKTEEDIEKLLDYVKGSGALEETQKEIERYTDSAIAALEPLNNSEAKEALKHLALSLAVRCI